MDITRAQAADRMPCTTPTAINQSSPMHLTMAAKLENEGKDRKDKKVDRSASFSILEKSISLKYTPDCGRSA